LGSAARLTTHAHTSKTIRNIFIGVSASIPALVIPVNWWNSSRCEELAYLVASTTRALAFRTETISHSPVVYFDAHNHLHDERIVATAEALARASVQSCVVNGTSEKDWPQVSALAKRHAWIIPAFGLHPWYTADRSANWFDTLRRFLDQHPNATIGEIGLDRWMRNPNLPDQEIVFHQQLTLAAERNMAVSIHCLKAWGALEKSLQQNSRPVRGLLLHSYGGSSEMIHTFSKLGAYFSFSGYFAHERKAAQREVFKQIPLDRLLLETDAPDMLPPPELQSVPADFNDPRNISGIYDYAARLWNISLTQLAARIEANFEALFLAASTASR
jgi:TatD DNase family protein